MHRALSTRRRSPALGVAVVFSILIAAPWGCGTPSSPGEAESVVAGESWDFGATGTPGSYPSSISSGSSAASGEPALAVSVESLDFGPLKTVLNFDVLNAGGGALDFTVSTQTPWLSLDKSSGTVSTKPVSVGVSATRAALGAGAFSGSIVVEAGGQQAVLPVYIQGKGSSLVSSSTSLLDVSKELLDFGYSESKQSFVVRNAGTGTMSFSTVSDVPWAKVSPASGVNYGEQDFITVSVDRAGLPPGSHVGYLTVNAGLGGLRSIEVRTEVVATDPLSPLIELTPPSLDFGSTENALYFNVRNSGLGTLDYLVVSSAAWLSVSPTSGSSTGEPDAILATVDRKALVPGVHNASIKVAGAGMIKTLPVTVSVPDGGGGVPSGLVISDPVLDLGQSEVEAWFTIQYNGTGSMGYTLSATEDWVELSATQGASSGEEDAIRVTCHRCYPWAAGAYSAEIRIMSEKGEQKTVTVLLSVAASPSDAQILAWLAPLPPLPKPHYAWPLPNRLLDVPNHPLLREYVRISSSASVHGHYYTPQHVANAVGACRYVNANYSPQIPATLAINYMPWYEKFPVGAPPTYNGPEVQQEVDLFKYRMNNIKNIMFQANLGAPTPVTVSILLLTCERWPLKQPGEPGAAEWNAAVVAKFNMIYAASKEVFPGVEVEWYGRGEVTTVPVNIMGDAVSWDLYQWYSFKIEEDWIKTIWGYAQAYNVDHMNAWLSLNAGWVFLSDNVQYFRCDWDYDPQLSWEMARYVHDPSYATPQKGPWDKLRAIVFHLEPFAEENPHWAEHFVAYVMGAHQMPLPPGWGK